MGISQAMGPDALRAGVVPDTASRPQSPFEGQLIFQRDTNQLLVYDGSAWVMIGDSDAPPGLQLVKTQTIGTAVASVTVSNAFSAEFDTYRIFINGGTASAQSNIALTLGSSSTGYFSGGAVYNTSNNAQTVITDNNAASWTRAATMDTAALSMDVTLIDPFLSKRTKIAFAYAFPASGNAGSATGVHTVETSYSAFTITPATGTMTGGTIRVYGFRNS